MWRLGAAWNVEAARAWRDVTPFPHLVIDDFAAADTLTELFAILDDEPVERYESDLFAFEATAPEPTTEGLRALRDGFAATLAPVLHRITGRSLARADMRAYAYRPGHHLLPHSDHQAGLGRAVAYAYYLPSPEPPIGGELELFDCELAGGELVSIRSAHMIEPHANRLVLFEVSDRSLHQVCEVTGGLRLSLAGWFYP